MGGRRLFPGLLVLLAVPLAQAACVAQSGGHTAALVELYTAQACSGCRLADRWLAELGRRFPPDQVIALALHIDYRDYLGSKDPYVQHRVSERRRRLLLLQRTALVYTPHVVLQGGESPSWASREFDDAVKRINSRPARARLKVEMHAAEGGALAAVVRGEVVDAEQREDAVLYLGAVQRRLRGEVDAGEGTGPGLAYGYLVLAWEGPFSGQNGELAVQRSLALLPGAKPHDSGVVAFVQNRRTAEVLQAVLLAACSP